MRKAEAAAPSGRSCAPLAKIISIETYQTIDWTLRRPHRSLVAVKPGRDELLGWSMNDVRNLLNRIRVPLQYIEFGDPPATPAEPPAAAA